MSMNNHNIPDERGNFTKVDHIDIKITKG